MVCEVNTSFRNDKKGKNSIGLKKGEQLETRLVKPC